MSRQYFIAVSLRGQIVTAVGFFFLGLVAGAFAHAVGHDYHHTKLGIEFLLWLTSAGFFLLALGAFINGVRLAIAKFRLVFGWR